MKLTVCDDHGACASGTATITIANVAPTVRILSPADGSVFRVRHARPAQRLVHRPGRARHAHGRRGRSGRRRCPRRSPSTQAPARRARRGRRPRPASIRSRSRSSTRTAARRPSAAARSIVVDPNAGSVTGLGTLSTRATTSSRSRSARATTTTTTATSTARSSCTSRISTSSRRISTGSSSPPPSFELQGTAPRRRPARLPLPAHRRHRASRPAARADLGAGRRARLRQHAPPAPRGRHLDPALGRPLRSPREAVSEKTPSWGIEPVPERLHVLSALDSTLLWGNLSVSLLVIVIGALLVPALSLRDALLAILVGAVVGNVLLGVAALHRGRRARPGDGGAARAARAARLVRADGAQRRAEPRLVDVRADHHRGGGRGALAASLRLERHVAVDARVRRAQLGPRHARPDRLRPPLPAQVRVLGAPLLDGVPHLLGDLEVAAARVLGAAGQGRLPVVRPGGRPRDRQRRLVDAARGRLHALRRARGAARRSAPASATSCRRSGASGSAS